MGRKRTNKDNKGLPPRWYFRYNAYWYLPRDTELANYDGKKWFRLGSTLAEAHAEFACRHKFDGEPRTMRDLCDRYEQECIPLKKPATRKSNLYSMGRIRKVFGESAIAAIQPRDIYQYRDQVAKKFSKKQYNLDHEVLSVMFTRSIEWGARSDHPMTNKKVTKFTIKPRTRYVEDWELAAFRSVCPPLIDAYLDLKGLTGLRRGDLLRLTLQSLTDEGIRVLPAKTEDSNPQPVVYAWNAELRAAIERIKALPRPVGSIFLFCTKKGQPYIKADGQASGWDSAWQRAMKRAIEQTDLTESFRDTDLRAKVASDADSVGRAQELLHHTTPVTTEKHYRRKAKVVQPAGGFGGKKDEQ